jgi:hypothetical protein
VLAATIAVLVPLGLVVAPVQAPGAAAADHAVGYRSGAGDWLGSYSAGGTYLYCLEPGKAEPVGSTSSLGEQQWAATPDDAARINWAITVHGQTTDPNVAAAVHLFVWSVAATAEYNSHGQSGDTWYVYRAPAAQRTAILANLNEIRAQAAAIVAAPAAGVGGSLTVHVDQLDHYKGTLAVSVPTTGTGTVTLTNGVFEATGTSTIAGVRDGAVLPIRGVPPRDATAYKINASGDWPGDGFAGSVTVYQSGPGQQYLGGPGPRAHSIHLEADDPLERGTGFAPVLTSIVGARYPMAGEPFVDTFTFSVAVDPETGLTNSWPMLADGGYPEITAKVTVYKTRSALITASGAVPDDAEVFTTFDVTTSEADGPTKAYTVSTREVVEAGFQYVAVSVIDVDDQREGTKPFLLPGYRWTDGWGVASEISTVAPTGRSQATPLQGQGLPVIDTAHLEGLIFDGAQVRFHAYARPASAEALFTSDDPDAIDPAAVCTPETLVYSSDPKPATAVTVSDGVNDLPIGVIDWVFEIVDSAGVIAWTAPCGPVSERTVIERVLVSTTAQTEVASTAPVHDTATISGTIEEGDGVSFATYRASLDADGNPVCDAGNLVWTSERHSLTPGVVDGLKVDSGDTRLQPGTYWWIETYTDREGAVVHEGACGLDNETSKVNAPKLAETGADGDLVQLVALLAIGGLLIGVVLLFVLRPRRRAQLFDQHATESSSVE